MSNGASPQPSLLSTLVNNTLVFCGLIVAGAMTLIASGENHDGDRLVYIFAIGAVIAGVLGGVAALFSNIHAHNLARRQEKHVAGQPTDKIDSARLWAARCAETSFWISVAAAAFALGLIAVFGIAHLKPAPAFVGMTVSTLDGSNRIQVSGPVRHVVIDEQPTRCTVDIRTDTLAIRTETASGCLVDTSSAHQEAPTAPQSN